MEASDRRILRLAAEASRHADGVRNLLRSGRAAVAAARRPDHAEHEARRLAAARAAAAVPLRKAMVTPDDLGPDLERLDAAIAKLQQPREPVLAAPRLIAPATRRPPVAQSSAPRAPSSAPALRGGHLAYWDVRDRIARDIRRGYVLPEPGAIIRHAVEQYAANVAEAAEWCDRFCGQLQRDLRRR